MKSSKNLVIVFVPSTGYLYFYFDFLNMYTRATLFSSPLRGISISTMTVMCINTVNVFSSPLRGISISTQSNKNVWLYINVFVPSTGYLYFYPRIPLENSKGIIWFAVQTHKPDNFMFISTCPELKMLYFTGIGAKS